MKAGKSEICRSGQQARNPGANILRFEAKFLLQGNISVAHKTFQLTDWMKSTQVIKDNLLPGSQLIGNVDLIYKIFLLQPLGECFIDMLEAVAYPS